MNQIGRPYKQTSIADTWDAIVIGSGIGGLTTAALLAKYGQRKVLVVERHYTAGGFTHVFRRPGYEWDAGVHYIGQANDPRSGVRAVFDHLTEGRLEWNPMPDVYDRIEIAGRSYDFPSGRERFRARLKEYFPSESRAIDKYLAAVSAAVRASGLYFAEKAIPGPLARVLGPAMRWPYLRYAGRTTRQVLDGLTSNQELIAVLTGQWGDYGLPPAESSFGMHAMVVHHYLEGAGYPVGGASGIAANIAPAIERAGGRIVVSADVSQVLVDDGGAARGVRMTDGREFSAPIVVSDAGAWNTCGRLLPEAAPGRAAMLKGLQAIPPSIAHLCLYVGLKTAPGDREFDATNLWIYSGGDHDAAMARFLADPGAPFPVLFISFPSAKDPTFAARYPGRSTIEVVAPIPYDAFAKWEDRRWKRRGADYDAYKAELSNRLLQELERHVPEVRGRIEFHELSTPLSTRHFANHAHGEIYGLAHTPARFRQRSLGARTPIRNLFLTGSDACTAGVTGALFGGVITASAILRRNLTSVLSRPYVPATETPALDRSVQTSRMTACL